MARVNLLRACCRLDEKILLLSLLVQLLRREVRAIVLRANLLRGKRVTSVNGELKTLRALMES